MANCHLFSYALSEPDVAVDSTLARIAQSILVYDCGLSGCKPLIEVSGDPFLPGAAQVEWAAEEHREQEEQHALIANAVEHFFLPILQRLLAGGATSAAWPVEIFKWQMPDFRSPGHVHAHSQQMLRRLSCPRVAGTRVTVFDHKRIPIQSLVLGQPLGLIDKSGAGILSGQVQHPRAIANSRNAISLKPRHGKSRTLLVSDGIDPERLDGKTILAVVRPVRGKIFYRLEGWSTPQSSLL